LPGGLLFVGLRDQTTICGWVWDGLPAAAALPEQVRRVSAEKLDEMVRLAEERAAACAEEIRSGVIDVTPTDRDHCEKYCDFRDVCRVAL
jgi:ATP-dependent helicase/DNAse subunit B